MTPLEVGPAIARVLMLTAGPLPTDEDYEPLRETLAAFDTAESLRQLATSLALHAYGKLPDGGYVPLVDVWDVVAFGIASNAARSAEAARQVAEVPDEFLGPVTIALLAIWRHACKLTAADALARIEVPDHAPEGR